MSTFSSWLFGSIMAVLGLVGLLLASRAMDPGIEFFGLALFVFAVLFDFGLIGRAYALRERDEAEAATERPNVAA